MKIIDLFHKEIQNPKTSYFILDSKGKEGDHGNVDFITYDWSPSIYNLVREGDVFLYRRPGRASENREFYFFGSGKINQIDSIGDDRVRALITKAIPFNQKLFREDLASFRWKFKERGDNWANFFYEYGMNKIEKDDFSGILKLAFGKETPVKESLLKEEISLIQQQQDQNYFVDDHRSEQLLRVGHKVFADKVKINYGYRCAITGIRLKEFLVASHIIPWAENKYHRTDPQNGICLSVLVDKAFDAGLLGITPDYKIKLSSIIQQDKVLYGMLKQYENKKIRYYSQKYPPNIDFLKWHYENKFKY